LYDVLHGKGLMIIDGEERDVSQGDLVYIPPNKVHSLVASSPHSPIRCFCFAVAEGESKEPNQEPTHSAFEPPAATASQELAGQSTSGHS
jgi:quercetin dioxygenase-like cupin family protein